MAGYPILKFQNNDNRMADCSVLKFQKNENRMASSGCPTRNRKIHQNKKSYICRSLSPINTTQWSESLPYCSITLKTFKHRTVKDVFQRKWKVFHCLCSTDGERRLVFFNKAWTIW